jgi:hypothetical protein
MLARGICNLVRALACPCPGANINNPGAVKAWKVSVAKGVPSNAELGKVPAFEVGQAIIRSGIDAIYLLETEPPFNPAFGKYL